MSTTKPMKQLECHEYTVGWICPIEIEFSASSFILDEEHEHPNIPADDKNQYICGQINGKKNVVYNVVIGCFPSGYQGTVASGALASRMAKTFGSLQLNLLVGIGGGVPDPKDIRLGDVVIAQPTGEHGGVVQYDLGKDTVSGFKRKGILLPPPTTWLAALNRMKRDHRRQGNRVSEYLEAMFKSYPKLRKSYGRPAEDILFESDYPHPEGNKSCKGCDPTRVVSPREKRDEPDEPVIHYGLVASGNAVMKNAEKRDTISNGLGGADCFEMEAAGLATDTSDFRCIVIRGVSDYADSHKNDDWHGYAAAAAAAVAKELLTYMPIDVTEVVPSSSAAGQTINNPSGSGSPHIWQNNPSYGNARVHHGHVYGNVIHNNGNQKTPVEQLLGSLSFPGMHRYHERPLDSHKGTYEWLLDDNRVVHCCEKCVDKVRELSREESCELDWHCRDFLKYDEYLHKEASKFRSWLRTSQEIFWVSGKAGAGKSCLMKFLLEHTRTTEMLHEWAGQRVVLVGFFFWAAGGKLERSHTGLLRSLLHQILQKQHNLAENLLVSTRDIWHDKGEWTVQRLQNALHNVVANTAGPTSFAFFIDGLDEFQGNTQDWDVHDLLKALNIMNQSKHVKICVSSRPWNIFENAFGCRASKLHLRLHELNRLDIDIYIQKRLIDDIGSHEEDAYDLVKAVRNKAQGVFLWVSLAVKSLRRAMGDMWSVSEMLKALDKIPPELEDLIQKIFDSIDPAHQQNASRTFLLLLECGTETYDSPMYSKLPLLWLAILIKDAKDTRCNDNEPATREACMDMITKADQAARRWCKDLVDVVRGDTCARDDDKIAAAETIPEFCSNSLSFPHRTIEDYILRRKTDGTLARLAGDDDYSLPALILCSIVAQLPRYACVDDVEHAVPLQWGLTYWIHLYHIFGSLVEGVEDNKGSALLGMVIDLCHEHQSLQRVGRVPQHWTWQMSEFYHMTGHFGLDPNEDSFTIFMACLLYSQYHKLFWFMFDAMPQWHAPSKFAYAKQVWLSVALRWSPLLDAHALSYPKGTRTVSRLLQQIPDLNTSVSAKEKSEHRSVWKMYLLTLYWKRDHSLKHLTGDWHLDCLDLLLQHGADPDAVLPVAWLEDEPAWMKYVEENKANDAAEIEGLPILPDEPSSRAGVQSEGITRGQEPIAASAPMSLIPRHKPHVVSATSVFDLPVRHSRLLERHDDDEEWMEEFFPPFKAKLVAASEAKEARIAGANEEMTRQQKRGRQLSDGSEEENTAARSGSKRQQRG